MHEDNNATGLPVAGADQQAEPSPAIGLSKCPLSHGPGQPVGCSKPPFIAQNKITANSLVEYPEAVHWQSSKAKTDKKAPGNNKASGTVTRKVNKRINDATKALSSRLRVQFYKGKGGTDRPVVITLTLPAMQGGVSDLEIKDGPLKNFMQFLQTNRGVVYALWKAERQKNQNIHFHILCDTYIPHTIVRAKWNEYLQSLGFIDSFSKKWGHTNPNSTDIHIAEKARNVESYVAKYVAKDDSNGQIEGRVWGCTKALKDLKNYVSPDTNEVVELKKELKQNRAFYKVYGEYYTQFKGDIYGYIFDHKDRFPELYHNLMQLNTVYERLHPN